MEVMQDANLDELDGWMNQVNEKMKKVEEFEYQQYGVQQAWQDEDAKKDANEDDDGDDDEEEDEGLDIALINQH